ncbi:trypsin-like peptidase domain-containing protein [Hymenobacter sp. ASUV-10]|uniref:Trypsin-like peptidase domain-containing protein n=1 Tax=Hymenobacter aranciens TaxID=3063996 RepID=A0ABT9BD42_9BACT|nr:trypsin-like peptidase domain-containing protein [Hymenobacter sp. ASUV-10]MDO7876137.1 trypsin-like peptidase domain-containing protein [Hymenobacter sp. ASUV-10]
MKHRFNRPICGLLLGSLLLPGCATIISTPYQTIRVVGLPVGSTIYVNNEAAKTKPVPTDPTAAGIRLSRKKNAEIKVKLDGYKDYITFLQPDKVNPVVYANVAAGLASIPFWFSESTSTYQLSSSPRVYTRTRTDFNVGAASVGLGMVLIAPLIDFGTGAGLRFSVTEIRPQLVRQPRAVAGSASIQAGTVNVRFKGGDKLGNLYVANEIKEILYFGKSLDVNSEKLKANVNGTLKELGYSVPATEGQSVFAKTPSTRFTVQGEMRELKYDVRASSPFVPQAHYETNCTVEVTWKLVNQNRQTVTEQKTTGTAVAFEEGGTAAFENAFENALYGFLEKAEVVSALSKTAASAEASEKPLAEQPATNKLAAITIHRSKVPPVPADGNGLGAAARSVVTIETTDGHGSGCLISADGYLITNAHVVGDAETVQVRFADGVEATGKIVRVNTDMDLALVKTEVDGLTGFQLPTTSIADLGSDVFAIGTPADKELGQSITKGIVSGRRKIEGHSFLQTDVSINGGNSGGALVTRSGQLVGIVNAKLVGKGIEGIGFAIPAEQVNDALQLKFVD